MTNEVYSKDVNGNTVLIHTEEVPDVALPLNWLGLEQSLVYSGLFSKAVETAHPNWFTVFSSCLQNGKRGEASENFLLYTISNLGVAWETEEKELFNQYLTQNNFTIQIT